jgi:hypothetical protein
MSTTIKTGIMRKASKSGRIKPCLDFLDRMNMDFQDLFGKTSFQKSMWRLIRDKNKQACFYSRCVLLIGPDEIPFGPITL